MNKERINLSKFGIDNSPKNIAIRDAILDNKNAFVYKDHGETVKVAKIISGTT